MRERAAVQFGVFALLALGAIGCTARTWILFRNGGDATCAAGSEDPACTPPSAPCAGADQVPFASGDGTRHAPFGICTAAQLAAIGADAAWMTADFRLDADIDLSGYAWTPLGTVGVPYQGWFDGATHVIAGLRVDALTGNGIGLFGHTLNARLERVTLDSPDVRASGAAIGALIGFASATTVYDVHVRHGTVVGHDSGVMDVGGLIGRLDGSRVFDSSVDAEVVTPDPTAGNVGGLVGHMNGSSVQRIKVAGAVTAPNASGVGGLVGYCYSIFDASRTHSVGAVIQSTSGSTVLGAAKVGGLVGWQAGFCDVIDSFSSGDVVGVSQVGGICGETSSVPRLEKTFAFGSVSGNVDVGGFVGVVAAADVVQASFWSSERAGPLSGLGNLADPPALQDLPVAQFLSSATFQGQGWSFGAAWEMIPAVDTRFPVLSWQGAFCADKQAAQNHRAYGAGTVVDPFRLCAPAQLEGLAAATADLDKVFALMTDIDLEGRIVEPIGSTSVPFTGRFLGNRHRIANLRIEVAGPANVGLFGVVDGSAVIASLELVNPRVVGDGETVGAVVGSLRGGWILWTSVSSSGATRATVESSGPEAAVGGLVGSSAGGAQLEMIWTDVDITSHGNGETVGGIAGVLGGNGHRFLSARGTIDAADAVAVGGISGTLLPDARVTASSAGGHVSALGVACDTGGVVGHAQLGAVVKATYSTTTVTGVQNIGGMVGRCDGCSIDQGYVSAAVRGGAAVGAIVGRVSGTSVLSHLFWNISLAPDVEYASPPGSDAAILGLEDAAMRAAATYVAAGWQPTGTVFPGTKLEGWRIVDGQTPYFAWESEGRHSPW